MLFWYYYYKIVAITNIKFDRCLHVVDNMVEEPISLSIVFRLFGPILVQMNLQHSQAQPYDVCTRVISLNHTLYILTK